MAHTMDDFKTFYINKLKNNHVNQYTVDGVTYSDLISYGRRVAWYNHNTNEMSFMGWFSNTTAKHINDFLEYYGFDKMTKQQLKQYES